MINFKLINPDDSFSFRNYGDLVSGEVISKTINIMSDYDIDLRTVNFDDLMYVNLSSDEITPEEINRIYNDVISK